MSFFKEYVTNFRIKSLKKLGSHLNFFFALAPVSGISPAVRFYRLDLQLEFATTFVFCHNLSNYPILDKNRKNRTSLFHVVTANGNFFTKLTNKKWSWEPYLYYSSCGSRLARRLVMSSLVIMLI